MSGKLGHVKLFSLKIPYPYKIIAHGVRLLNSPREHGARSVEPALAASKSECSATVSFFHSNRLTQSKWKLANSKRLFNNTKTAQNCPINVRICTILGANFGNFSSRQIISSNAFKFPLQLQKLVTGTSF
jgi:hypothetical protein